MGFVGPQSVKEVDHCSLNARPVAPPLLNQLTVTLALGNGDFDSLLFWKLKQHQVALSQEVSLQCGD